MILFFLNVEFTVLFKSSAITVLEREWIIAFYYNGTLGTAQITATHLDLFRRSTVNEDSPLYLNNF